MEALSEALGEAERARGLKLTRGIDPGFAVLARDWARGKELRRVLTAAGTNRRGKATARQLMTGGDFVRNTKQLIDLLRQLAMVAPSGETRGAAEQAARRLRRGVVAASSQVGTGEPGPPGGAQSIHASGSAAS